MEVQGRQAQVFGTDRAAWMRWRRALAADGSGPKIGGSQVPMILGRSPFGGPADVVARCADGLLSDQDEETLPANMAAGHIGEQLLLDRMAALLEPASLDRQVGVVGPLGWDVVSLDGLADEGQEEVTWEIKLVFQGQRDHYRAGLADYVEDQVAWGLGVTGLEKARVGVGFIRAFDARELPDLREAVLCCELRIFTLRVGVEIDPAHIEQLREYVSLWRELHLIGGVPPRDAPPYTPPIPEEIGRLPLLEGGFDDGLLLARYAEAKATEAELPRMRSEILARVLPQHSGLRAGGRIARVTRSGQVRLLQGGG